LWITCAKGAICDNQRSLAMNIPARAISLRC
jgi:hypothetical protein